jgi:hypothetical protein
MKKSNTKMIELTPEWVLRSLGDDWYTDGFGKAFVTTTKIHYVSWIELALDTLEIEWNISENIDEFDDYRIYFEFRIQDIKNQCSDFFEELNEDNSLRFKQKNENGFGLN